MRLCGEVRSEGGGRRKLLNGDLVCDDDRSDRRCCDRERGEEPRLGCVSSGEECGCIAKVMRSAAVFRLGGACVGRDWRRLDDWRVEAEAKRIIDGVVPKVGVRLTDDDREKLALSYANSLQLADDRVKSSRASCVCGIGCRARFWCARAREVESCGMCLWYRLQCAAQVRERETSRVLRDVSVASVAVRGSGRRACGWWDGVIGLRCVARQCPRRIRSVQTAVE
jgi:hypothetical protein